MIQGQIDYYRARAREYDEWFLRQGRYDRGAEHRREWFREIQEMETVLRATVRGGAVLELACGTGLWTRHLAENNSWVVAVDASPEVIALNRERLRSRHVSYIVADIFSWMPSAKFDAVFFSFWLSHVPGELFRGFWTDLRTVLKPGGRVFFLDSRMEPTSTARDHAALNKSGVIRRKLNDGREFDIVKIFYEPSELERNLMALGWRGWVRSTRKFFFYGSMSPVTRDEIG